jgi:hypothetical protein
MGLVSVKFTVLPAAPANDDEAARLSTLLTMNYGQHGWEPLSTTALGNGRLLVTWKMVEGE